MSTINIKTDEKLQEIRKFCLEQTPMYECVDRRLEEAEVLFIWILSGTTMEHLTKED